MNVGRPSKRTPEIVAEIVTILKMGFGIETAADFVRLNPCTIHDWKSKDTDFAETVKKAVADGKAYVCGKLMAGVKKGNLGSIIFWLKCRGGPEWQEVKPTTRTTPFDLSPITTAAECVIATSHVVQRAAKGQMPMEQAKEMVEMIAKNAVQVERGDMEERMQRIEERLGTE